MFKHALIQDAAYQSMIKSKRQQIHERIARGLEVGIRRDGPIESRVAGRPLLIGGEGKRGGRVLAGGRPAVADDLEPRRSGRSLHPGPPAGSLAARPTARRGRAASTRPTCRSRRRLPGLRRDRAGGRPCPGRGPGRGDRRLGHPVPDHLGHVGPFDCSATRWTPLSTSPGDAVLAESRQEPGQPRSLVLGRDHAVLPGRVPGLPRGPATNPPGGRNPGLCRSNALNISQDTGATYRCYRALSAWYMGRPDDAWHQINEAVEYARGADHPFQPRLRAAPRGLGLVSLPEGRGRDPLRRRVSDSLGRAGFPVLEGAGADEPGTRPHGRRPAPRVVASRREALAAYLRTGSRKSLAEYHGFLAEIHWKAGRLDDATREVVEALEIADRTNSRCQEAELHRIKGEILLARGSTFEAEAEACFVKGLEVARRQSAGSWELRVATSLAKLRDRQGRRQEAKTLLSEAYGKFTRDRRPRTSSRPARCWTAGRPSASAGNFTSPPARWRRARIARGRPALDRNPR